MGKGQTTVTLYDRNGKTEMTNAWHAMQGLVVIIGGLCGITAIWVVANIALGINPHVTYPQGYSCLLLGQATGAFCLWSAQRYGR